MTAQELIDTYRRSPNEQTVKDLSIHFQFESVIQDDIPADSNIELRTEVVNELLDSFSIADILLIRSLFKEEVNCDRATWGHANLYQLCFYLYSLGQLEDTFILYEAKYNAPNMDTGTMLDKESITVGHEIVEVIAYVETRFEKEPTLMAQYPNMLADLKDLQLNPDYDSVATYSKFIKGYFFGHEEIRPFENTPFQKDSQATQSNTPKPWWKFW